MSKELRLVSPLTIALTILLLSGFAFLGFGLELDVTPTIVMILITLVAIAVIIRIALRRRLIAPTAFLIPMIELPFISFTVILGIYLLDIIHPNIFQYYLPDYILAHVLRFYHAIFFLSESSPLPIDFLLWLIFLTSTMALSLLLILLPKHRPTTLKDWLRSKQNLTVLIGLVLESLPLIYILFVSNLDPSSILFGFSRQLNERLTITLFCTAGFLGAILFARGSRYAPAFWRNLTQTYKRELLMVISGLALGYFSETAYYQFSLPEQLGQIALALKSFYITLSASLVLMAGVGYCTKYVEARCDMDSIVKVLSVAGASVAFFALGVYFRLPAYGVSLSSMQVTLFAVLLAASTSFILAFLLGVAAGLVIPRITPPILSFSCLLIRVKRYLQLERGEPQVGVLPRASTVTEVTSFQSFAYFLVELGFASFWVVVFFIEELRILTIAFSSPVHSAFNDLERRYFLFFFSDMYFIEPRSFLGLINEVLFSDLIIPAISIPSAIVTLLIVAEIGGITLNGKTITPKSIHRFLSLVIVSAFIIKTVGGWYGESVSSRIFISLSLLLIQLSGFALALVFMRDYIRRCLPSQLRRWQCLSSSITRARQGTIAALLPRNSSTRPLSISDPELKLSVVQ